VGDSDAGDFDDLGWARSNDFEFHNRVVLVWSGSDGLVIGEIVVTGYFASNVVPKENDFTSIVSNPFLSATIRNSVSGITATFYR